MYIPRAIEPAVLAAAKAFPVILVTGPRQVGKTTLLKPWKWEPPPAPSSGPSS